VFVACAISATFIFADFLRTVRKVLIVFTNAFQVFGAEAVVVASIFALGDDAVFAGAVRRAVTLFVFLITVPAVLVALTRTVYRKTSVSNVSSIALACWSVVDYLAFAPSIAVRLTEWYFTRLPSVISVAFAFAVDTGSLSATIHFTALELTRFPKEAFGAVAQAAKAQAAIFALCEAAAV